jgi:Tol biopolymer transport system component
MYRKLAIALAVVAALIAACGGGGGKQAAQTSGGGEPAPTAAGGAGAATGATMTLVRDQRVMVRAPNGAERMLYRTPPNTFPDYPVWSPDGTRIAYAQTVSFTGQPNTDWGSDIYVIPAEGGKPELIWKHEQPGEQVQGLAWTPDGKALLMGYQATLIKDGKYEGQQLRIERLDLASGARTTVIDGGTFPSLTKDGTRIAYETQTDTGQGGIWVAGSDGSGAKKLVDIGQKFPAVLYPHISPDGSVIAFAAVSPQQSAAPRPTSRSGLAKVLDALRPAKAGAHGLPMDVWSVSTADGTVTRLTRFAEDEPYPVWWPDGKKISIFATGGLYTMNPDGSDLKKIGQGSFGGKIDVR